MRIPFEALTQFLTGRPPDAKRTEPVAASADLGEAPQFSLRHWTPGEEHGNRDGHSAERGPGEAPTPNSLSAQPPPGRISHSASRNGARPTAANRTFRCCSTRACLPADAKPTARRRSASKPEPHPHDAHYQ